MHESCYSCSENPSDFVMRPYNHRPPPSPPLESESWIKPVKSAFHRTSMKRRCGSPSLFPKKVHVTEEKVAEEFGNLTLCGSSMQALKPGRTEVQKPDFLLDGKTRRKTFQELEDSIETDSLKEVHNDHACSVELAPELATELRKMSRKILSAGSYRLATKRSPYNPCQELVLWQPPSGSIVQILNSVKESTGSYYIDDEYLKYPGTRLDRIEEEDDSQLPEHSQLDEMETTFNTIAPNQQPLHDKTRFVSEKPATLFDVSDMDFSMDL